MTAREVVIALPVHRLKNIADVFESSAGQCLIAMGLCDILFCLLTVASSLFQHNSLIYQEKHVSFYLAMYGNYFQNVFLKTSTAITVIIGLLRYIVSSRKKMLLKKINKCLLAYICGASFVFLALLYLPLLWNWEERVISCEKETLFVIQPGVFQTNTLIRKSFENLWVVIGFVIPFCVLCYCNAWVLVSSYMKKPQSKIRQIHSKENHENMEISGESLSSKGYKKSPRRPKKSCHRCTSLLLVSIVLCFIALVTPSEVLHVYITHKNLDINDDNNLTLYRVFIVCNILQAVNMSCNFAMYCLLSPWFRKTLKKIICVGRVCSQRSKRNESRDYCIQDRLEERSDTV